MMRLAENSSLWGLKKKGKGKLCKCSTHHLTEKEVFGYSGQEIIIKRQSMDFKNGCLVFFGGETEVKAYNQAGSKEDFLFFRAPHCTALDHSCSWWPDTFRLLL